MQKDHMSTICTEHIIGDERIVLGCFYPTKVYLRLMIILLCVVWWLGFGLILGPYNSISQVRRGSTLFASTHLNSSVVYRHKKEYTIGCRCMWFVCSVQVHGLVVNICGGREGCPAWLDTITPPQGEELGGQIHL